MTDADIMGEPEEIEFTAMVSMYRRLRNKETTAGALQVVWAIVQFRAGCSINFSWCYGCWGVSALSPSAAIGGRTGRPARAGRLPCYRESCRTDRKLPAGSLNQAMSGPILCAMPRAIPLASVFIPLS